jgi:hypothetical protein
MLQISKFKLVAVASAVATMGALGAMAPSSSYSQGQEQPRTGSGATYISGGVGIDSVERLNSQARDFNLKLVFTLNEGNYLANVPVTITDGRGNKVIEAVSEGPLFLAKLPAGSYTVTATNDGKTQTRKVTVGQGQQTAYLRWPAAATDNPLPREQASRSEK